MASFIIFWETEADMFFLSATSEISSEIESIDKTVDQLSKYTEMIVGKLVNLGFDILTAIIIFIVGKFVIRMIRKLVKNIFTRSGTDIGVSRFIDSLIKVVGYVIVLIIICGQIGIETTSLITLLGTAGLSIGLALQGCLSNFAGGILILISKPFKVGDYIILKGAGENVEGTVEKIDIIHTTLSTIDNKIVQCPNGTVSNCILVNVTNQDFRRVDVAVGIHYEDDLGKAKAIAETIVDQCEYRLKDQESQVVVKQLGESSVILELRMWTLSEDYWRGMFYLNENIKKAFEENGIRIPYNQLDVHIHQPQE